jgi:hypothetical protein
MVDRLPAVREGMPGQESEEATASRASAMPSLPASRGPHQATGPRAVSQGTATVILYFYLVSQSHNSVATRFLLPGLKF